MFPAGTVSVSGGPEEGGGRAPVADPRTAILGAACLDAPWGIALASPHDGTLEAANAAFADMHGRTVEDLAGRRLDDLVAPDARRRAAELLRRLNRAGRVSFGSRHLRADGTVLPVWIDAWAVRRPGEGVARHGLAAIDLSGRGGPDPPLPGERPCCVPLADSNVIGIFESDLAGRIVCANDAFLAMMGLRRDDLPLHSDTITPPRWRERDLTARSELEAHGFAAPWEKEFRRRDGGVVPVLAGAALLQPPSRGFTCFVMNLTGQKLAQERAGRMEADLAHVCRVSTLGEMASTLAHQINQPLCAIAGYAEGCLDLLRTGDAAARRELADKIAEVASLTHRTAEIVRRLRSLVRKSEPVRAAVEINDLVGEVAALIEPEARYRGLRLRVEPGDGLPAVMADSVQIQQVVLNLARNGLEAMEAAGRRGGELVISTGATGGPAVTVSVHDGGPGLPAELANAIFEPFVTTKPGGLGMGLPISRTIVESHGGRLWAETSAAGATFRLTLPAATTGPDVRGR